MQGTDIDNVQPEAETTKKVCLTSGTDF